MPNVTVRDARASDVTDLYEVCLLTGDAGSDASERVSYPRLMGDIYVGPYLEFAPDFALVADDEERAAGYALAVLDTARFEDELVDAWWPGVQEQYSTAEPSLDFDAELLKLVRNPLLTRHPDLAGYPSHLHIDLMAHVRGQGVGSRMLAVLFERLRAAGSPGVHLGVDTANEAAQTFYRRLGFGELQRKDGELFMGLTFNAG